MIVFKWYLRHTLIVSEGSSGVRVREEAKLFPNDAILKTNGDLNKNWFDEMPDLVSRPKENLFEYLRDILMRDIYMKAWK